MNGPPDRQTGDIQERARYPSIIETKHGGKPWDVVVEPDESLKILVVITGYPA